MAKCPKCGRRLTIFDWRPNCPGTAIYGARAANGVIVITTKKGRAGAPDRKSVV